ncbi:MAG: hypothetical protein NW205_08055 [Hyphomicrobiaceae bacterium]|nr:hypothetical protein [Hyphomicrobiaceae bacterium]
MSRSFAVAQPATTASDFDVADVPGVSAADMAVAIAAMVRSGQSNVLFQPRGKAAREAIEAGFWSSFRGPTAAGVATLLRFWALVDAFAHSRLKSRLMNEGFALLGPAGAVAAGQRLNATWGFAPQRLMWALADAIDRPEAPAPLVLIPRSRAATAEPAPNAVEPGYRLAA